MIGKQAKFLEAAAKKRREAVALRAKGWSMQEIATKHGISRQRVSNWLKLEAKKAAQS